MITKTFTVNGMHCASCSAIITKKLSKLDDYYNLIKLFFLFCSGIKFAKTYGFKKVCFFEGLGIFLCVFISSYMSNF